MRTEVKLGLFASLAMIVVAGLYFSNREEQSSGIPLLDTLSEPSASREGASREGASTGDASAKDKDFQTAPKRVNADGTRKQQTGRNENRPGRRDQRLADGSKGGAGDPGASRPQTLVPQKREVGSAADSRRPVAGQGGGSQRSDSRNRKIESGEGTVLTIDAKPSTTDGNALGNHDASTGAAAKAADKAMDAGTRRDGPTIPRIATKSSEGAESEKPVSAQGDTTSGANSPLRATAPAGGMETHTVQEGDSFIEIARMYFGSDRFAESIAKANPEITDPTNIAIGTAIRIPSDATLSSDASGRAAIATPPAEVPNKPASDSGKSLPGRSHTVEDGDSLYALARRYLGDGGRWDEIYRKNKSVIGDDPARLKLGAVLAIPPVSGARGRP